MAMPTARAICYKSSLLAGRFIFYGKPKPSHSLVACEFLVFNSNKNQRYAWLLAVGFCLRNYYFLSETRTCAYAWFASIPIANTTLRSTGLKTIFHTYDASFFTKTQQFLCISFALTYSLIVQYKRFWSYLASPILAIDVIGSYKKFIFNMFYAIKL